MKKLLKSIRPLARQIAALQAQARALGLFANDRELLTCQHCGLMEDVLSNGMLITSNPDRMGIDTRMRFKARTRNKFRCPNCGAAVTESPPVEIEHTRKVLEVRK